MLTWYAEGEIFTIVLAAGRHYICKAVIRQLGVLVSLFIIYSPQDIAIFDNLIGSLLKAYEENVPLLAYLGSQLLLRVWGLCTHAKSGLFLRFPPGNLILQYPVESNKVHQFWNFMVIKMNIIVCRTEGKIIYNGNCVPIIAIFN